MTKKTFFTVIGILILLSITCGIGFMLGYGHPLWWYHPTKYAQLKTVYEDNGLNFARILLPWAGPSANLVAYTHERTGPGNALDGGLKFDLTKIDTTFLGRLRDMVAWAAGCAQHGAV